MLDGNAHRQCRRLLQTGVSPSDLALAVTIGIVLGCLPIFGLSTLLCAALAIGMRLNLIAIQAANWFAMPFQVLLFLPFLRLGQWLFRHRGLHQTTASLLPGTHSLLRDAHPLLHILPQFAWMAAHLLTAWIVVALPVALLLHLTLRSLFRRLAPPA